MPQLTEDQAYLAMFRFLEAQFELGSKELGGLLGSMSLLADGSTADPAMAGDWRDAVQKALAGSVDATLQLKN